MAVCPPAQNSPMSFVPHRSICLPVAVTGSNSTDTNQRWISYLQGDYERIVLAQEDLATPASWQGTTQGTGFTSNPIKDFTAPNHDLSENQGYSRLLIEQYQLDARKNPLLAESLAGVFSEVPLMSQPDPNIDKFSILNTFEGEYRGDATIETGNYRDSSLPPHPPPKLLVSSSPIPISNSDKIHACTHCGKLFDRWTRARDCAYKALDQAPHQCGGRCGNVGCTFSTSSEQLLNEHLNPRSVACPLCSVMTSKKNLARHLRETCVNRSLAANAHS